MRRWHHVETDRGSRKRLRFRKGDQPFTLFWVFLGLSAAALAAVLAEFLLR